MTIDQCIDMIVRGETSEQYKKRNQRLRKLTIERDYLQDAILILGNDERALKKQARLQKVLMEIDRLK